VVTHGFQSEWLHHVGLVSSEIDNQLLLGNGPFTEPDHFPWTGGVRNSKAGE